MVTDTGNSRFVNYPSRRMLEKAGKSRGALKYAEKLVEMVHKDTGMPIPGYARR
jgi:hypothetical protein